MQEFIRSIRLWWMRRDPTTRLLPHYMYHAIRDFNDYGSRQAAALAYYTVFSIFPLALLLTILIGRLLGAAVAQEQVARGLTLFIPPETAADLVANINQVLEQSSSFGVIALAGLVWSGLGLFSNVIASLEHIFQTPASRRWRPRLMALVMLLILIILVTASFLTSGILGLIGLAIAGRPSTWISTAVAFLPMGLNVVIFILLFRFGPTRLIHWDAIWPAAIFGGAGWELAKAGFGWYLSNFANYQVIYGSIATAIILLFWAYLTASIFIFSAQLCAQLNNWLALRHASSPEHFHTPHARPRLPE